MVSRRPQALRHRILVDRTASMLRCCRGLEARSASWTSVRLGTQPIKHLIPLQSSTCSVHVLTTSLPSPIIQWRTLPRRKSPSVSLMARRKLSRFRVRLGRPNYALQPRPKRVRQGRQPRVTQIEASCNLQPTCDTALILPRWPWRASEKSSA